MMRLWKREPALIVGTFVGVVDAGVILLASFGVPISDAQHGAINGFAAAVLALVGLVLAGVVTRSRVSPTPDR